MFYVTLFLLLPTALTDYCSQFKNCESCAGRHHDTFEECVWCSPWNTCVAPLTSCKAIHQEQFDCPIPINVQYNETFTRNIVAPIIAAAQGSYEQIQQCLNKLPGRVQLWRRFYIRSEIGRDRTDGYLAVDFDSQAIILSFSTVSGGRKLLYNNRFGAEFFNNRQALFDGTDGLVNRFVYDSFNRIWHVLGMESMLERLLGYYKDFEIWCVGHSIGGAKAELAAVSVVKKNLTTSNKVKLVTFGSVRLGDNSWVQLVEDLVPYRFRIVHRQDLVVRFPRKFAGEWTPPHHHRFEVWYPGDMHPGSNYTVCAGAEDPKCSSQLPQWQQRAEDNDFYFERSMENWAQYGCAGLPQKKSEKQPNWKVATTTPTTTTTTSTTSQRPVAKAEIPTKSLQKFTSDFV